MNEFELIERFFDLDTGAADVRIGIGDDGAIVSVPLGHELVVSVDSLVSGRHFPDDLAPELIAHRSLAVNLSDMAAMGASPRWMTLSLCLPNVDESWLAGFSNGLRSLATQHHVSLIGGDTVKGPLCITLQILGLVTKGQALLRSTAQVGDEVYVTGTLGCAAAAVDQLPNTENPCFARFAKPCARVREGMELVGLATAAIDVSDGLVADLQHIAESSGVGVCLNLDQLPITSDLVNLVGKDSAIRFASTGGDDYELCFTVPANLRDGLLHRTSGWPTKITRIGRVVKGEIVKCYLDGNRVYTANSGFDHFAESV